MTNEQHKWYLFGYNDARREQLNPMMNMPHDEKVAMAYGIQPTQKKITTEDKYLYLNWQDGQNEWFVTAAPFKCTKFKFKVETL